MTRIVFWLTVVIGIILWRGCVSAKWAALKVRIVVDPHELLRIITLLAPNYFICNGLYRTAWIGVHMSIYKKTKDNYELASVFDLWDDYVVHPLLFWFLLGVVYA